MRYIKLAIAALAAIMLVSCNEVQVGEEHYLGEVFDKNHIKGEEITGATISFASNKAEITGSGASMEDNTLYITKAGSYTLSGEFEGAVIVEVTKTEEVELILGGVTISNPQSSAIYVKTADKVTLTLADGTENTLSDGETYALENEAEPNACVYSADDLTIKGNGELSVYAKCKNGIQTKNDLRIKGGDITVTAPNNALKGKDSVEISGGNITVSGADDGIKSDNEAEEERGTVCITGGNITITCQDDGIQAYRSVEISGDAKVYIDANDKDINCDGEVNVDETCLVEAND